MFNIMCKEFLATDSIYTLCFAHQNHRRATGLVNMAPTVEAHTANDDIMIIYYLKIFKIFKMYLFHGTQNMLFWF
jgi:hypothetical protein